ncbi:MAG: T9SS type A sorting domain-containing protein [Candidatus Cloacimonas sp.]|jgi:hypothetical protein|nr:T9SS type A sorting domain-containing protein [Candidatus Cloacimonas sp.]
MRNLIITTLLSVFVASALLAAGPGNVSSGLQMWLDANALSLNNNDPVSSWTDMSGNTKHATQDTLALRPLYKTNMINGKPAIVFDGLTDGTGDYLFIDGNLVVNTNYTILAVVKRTSSSPSSLHMFLGGSEKSQNKNLHVGWRTNNTFTHAQYTNDYDMRVANYAAAASANIFSLRHSATLGNDTYINGALRGLNMNAESSARFTHLSNWQGASIGRYIDGSINNRLNGWVAELIIYNRYLSETERKAVEAYLAGKYALTVYDTATPEHYTNMFEIAVKNPSPLTQTKESGGLTLQGTYLTAFARIRAGHDAAEGTSTTFNPDALSYPNFMRLKREWFMEFTSSNISTVYSFDLETLLPDFGTPSGDKYRLLYRADNNSNYSIISSSPSINGKIISFTVNPMVPVSNSGLYALGTLDNDESTLPVELSSFMGLLTPDNNVRLEWITQSETGICGFYVLRSSSTDVVTAAQISSLIPANNGSGSNHYDYTDTELNDDGTYYYWLQSNNLDGSSEQYGPVAVEYHTIGEIPTPGIPIVTGLTSVYPNPFNPSVSISYALKQSADVQISVFNMKGQKVKQWYLPMQKEGHSTLVWNSQEFPSGVYLLCFVSGNHKETKKITIAK